MEYKYGIPLGWSFIITLIKVMHVLSDTNMKKITPYQLLFALSTGCYENIETEKQLNNCVEKNSPCLYIYIYIYIYIYAPRKL